jgi:hydroxyacylglutathione hydrolase
MRVEIIETSGLGDRSYVVSDGQVAVVIDAQRDIDRVLDLLRDRGARITHVLETHLHNDYVTGGLELALAVDAEYVVPAGDDLGYRARRVSDGDIVDAGAFQLRVLHTPGHTVEHASYVLLDGSGSTAGVFTGGSMLYDSTGRTDLLGDDSTRALTTAQYHSVRRIADEVPDHTPVYPTHGFGSFCSASAAGRDESTIGEQRKNNPALTQPEQAFLDELLADLAEYPAYYAHMGVLNRDGPVPIDLTTPAPVDPAELRRRIEAGDWVIDLRSRTAFASGHVGGTYGFELADSFVTYVGWLYAWGAPLTLIGDDEDQIASAQRELARIGIDGVNGGATGDVQVLAGESALRSYRVADFDALAVEPNRSDLTVLDVRRNDEFGESHVVGAVNVPVHELADRIDELPDGPLWVHCASGYRASVAASILDKHQRSVVLIDDDFAEAESNGLTN